MAKSVIVMVLLLVALLMMHLVANASTLTTAVSVRISDEPVVIEPAVFSTSVGASVPLHSGNQETTRIHNERQ
jgi:hypothetical protein